MSHFYFWYFKYILMLIFLYFYLSKILNAGLLLVTKYFYTVLLLLFKAAQWNLNTKCVLILAVSVDKGGSAGRLVPREESRRRLQRRTFS